MPSLFSQAFGSWGRRVHVPEHDSFNKKLINNNIKESLEDVVFRNEKFFKAANLENHVQFWEEEILKDHPNKNQLLNWIKGVPIEKFLSPFTDSTFKKVRIRSRP